MIPHSKRLLKVICAVLLTLCISPSSQAQGASNFFLHGTGSDANPSTLFLNTTAPTSDTAKYKDSTSINYNGGNPWQSVGNWPANPVPSAGTLTAISPLHVWLGLKNSDDQGTNFDIRAEISKNGTVVAAGQSLCITGITRNPANAKEATVSFGSFPSEAFNGTTDGFSLKILTRIGTNPDGAKCTGHNNAVGIRLYFDAASRTSGSDAAIGIQPAPVLLSPNPIYITVGAAGELTASLSPTPDASGVLTANSSAPNVATVPNTVPFNSGQNTVSVPVTAISEGNTLITVSLNGGSASSTVQVTPVPPTITSLSPNALSITQGGSGILIVTISSAQTVDTSVTLSSISPEIVYVPSSVTIPAGQISASISVSANSPGSAQIFASLNGTSTAITVTVTSALPTVISVLPPARSVTLGATTALTVTISAAQQTDTIISVSTNPGGIVIVPVTVTVLAGQTFATIPVGTLVLGQAMVQAGLNATTAEAAVQVVPPAPTLVYLLPSDLSVVVGATGTLTLTLNAAQLTNQEVQLSVDNATLLLIPSTVTVPQGEINASFTLTGLAVGDAVVTGSLNGTSQTTTIHVIPYPSAVISLQPDLLSIQQGATGTFTLTINAAQLSDTIIPITNSESTVLQAPDSVTVPAGQIGITFSVSGLEPGNATITASINATTVSAAVQVMPPPTIVTGLTPTTLSLPKGQPGILHVAISPASSEPQIVALISNNTTVAQVPSTLTIPAGTLGADFPVLSLAEGEAFITATISTGSASALVIVTPAELVTITLSPDAPAIFVGGTLPFIATGTFTDGTTHDITMNVIWNSSNQAIATINSTGMASAVASGTTTITATSDLIRGSTPLIALAPPPPTISGFSPTSGLVGSMVTINGANLNAAVSVLFNGVPAAISGITATTITAVVSNGATSGPITITTPYSSVISNGNFTVLNPVPSIASITPQQVFAGSPSFTLTLQGSGFMNASVIKFSGSPIPTTFINETQLTGTVDSVLISTTGNYPVIVDNPTPGGGSSNIINLLVENPIPPDPGTIAPVLDETVSTTLARATEFLYTGANPIQTGVAAGTIEPKRVAVLRGKVSLDDGSSLSGVKITILNHTEFGNTFTRADGMFDMAVNGGGYLTVTYQKDGYLPVQRLVNAPWQDYAWLPDVVMIQYDTKVTAIDLNSTAPIQVARGNPTIDIDGTRTATLFFQQGSTATMTLANGTTQAIINMSIRATEYTVGSNGPKRMPAPLPPTSGYTYAVELSADEAVVAGAKFITFNKPVISYTENFLNFPVGTPVPVGYYDRDKGIWTASDDGKIIKIISITNGMADIDINGTNTPASASALSSLGITDAERQTLATLYQAGQSLWRVQLFKLMDPDYNWSIGVALGQDAKSPNQPPAKTDTPPAKPTVQCGSIIGCENQRLGETLDIAGTPLILNYQSDRVKGRIASRTLEIPLSGAAVPSSLKRIELEIYVAGRKFTYNFGAAANQSYTFTWDGKDGYGRTLQGKQDVTVRIGYVYHATYFAPASGCPKGFACSVLGGALAGNVVSFERSEYTMWQEQQTAISNFDASSLGLGAWMLNIHHAYDPTGQTLYLGSGEKRSAKDINNIITTSAGSSRGYIGDGGPATSAMLNMPNGVAVDAKGNIFIADTFNHTIRMIGINGIITTVAGNVGFGGGYNGDGLPATGVRARLNYPHSVVVDTKGNIFIADTYNHRIRKVGTDDIITTVAGNGIAALSGDGGPAANASLYLPSSVDVDDQGNIFIADSYNSRIRKVGTDGTITTVAGTGFPGFSGDSGSATNAALNYPWDVAVDGQGNLFIADTYNHKIRKVRPDGIITTLATLAWPAGIAVDRQGNLFVGQHDNGLLSVARIRRVSPDGIITSVAGNGIYGYSGDNGPATGSKLYSPRDVAVDAQGYLFIADTENDRIRKVSPPLPGFTSQDIAIPSEDGKELYDFDQYGKHLITVDAITGITKYTFTYNTSASGGGYLTSITDRDGNITTIERDGSGNATAIIASGGQRTVLTMDANGYLASITNPVAQSFSFAYDNDGLMTAFTNPRGNTSTFTYDSLGRLTKDTNAIGGYKALTRTDNSTSYTVAVSTALGRTDTYTVETLSTGDTRRTNTDPNNLTTTTNIGTNGTTTTTSPDGTIATKTEGPDPRWGMQSPVTTALTIKTPSNLTYTMSGSRTATLSDSTNLLSLTSATDTVTLNGKTFTNTYDASLKKYTFTTPMTRKTYTILDTNGRVASEQLASLNAVNYGYDSKGRLTTVTQGLSLEARNYSIAYDPVGWALPTSITDPLGRSVHFVYDNAGRVTQKTLPDGRTITFSYDANGNVTSITPPSRPAHAFTYTGVDLEEQYSPPDIGIGATNTFYTYNLDKQLTLITRPDGQTVTLGYETGGRLSAITSPAVIPAQAGIQLSYAYSTTGNLSTITAPSETLSFTYDGSLLTKSTWTGAIAGSAGFTYNSDFRVSAETVNGANSVSFTYDNDGLLTGAGSLTISRNTQNGFITGTTLSSVSDALTYNLFGEPISYNATYGVTTLLNEQYTRDKLGRITQKTETVNSAADTYTYNYDTAGRLTDVAKNGSNTAHYEYDANSNRISYTKNNTTTATATYDNQDRLLSYGANTYTYTANGELATKTAGGTTTSYSYDVLGNLVSLTLPSGKTIEYIVDGQNRRIGKKVNGVLTQGFLYRNQIHIAAELDGQGNVVSRFIYGSKINIPDFIIKGGVTYRIVSDLIGSPRIIVNTTTGAIAQQIDYDEFGNIALDTNPGFQPFAFAGGLYDSDTGLVRFGYRDYDPESGRWTAKDPIGFDGGDTNLFGYVVNDAINKIDPFGLWYIDLNLTGAANGVFGPGGTVGFQIGPSGVNFYYGFGIGFGAGGSATFNLGDMDTCKSNVNVGVTFSGGYPVLGVPVGAQGSLTTDMNGNISPDFGAGLGLGFGVSIGATQTIPLFTW